MTNYALWDYVITLFILALKGRVSFPFMNGNQVSSDWAHQFRAYTGCRPIGCVRQMFYLLFLFFTTELILAASLGVDSSTLQPCWMDVLQLHIRLNIFPWVQKFYTVAMFVSNPFSFNVKSIALYHVWNAKLNLFIISCAVILRWMSWGSQPFIHTSIVRVGQHRCERVDRTWREMKPAIDDAAVNATQMRNCRKWHETLDDYMRQLYCGNIWNNV